MSDQSALQAFEDAYNEQFGWPKSQIDPDDPVQKATLAALRAAAPHLDGDGYQASMSTPEQQSYIREQLRLESEGDA